MKINYMAGIKIVPALNGTYAVTTTYSYGKNKTIEDFLAADQYGFITEGAKITDTHFASFLVTYAKNSKPSSMIFKYYSGRSYTGVVECISNERDCILFSVVGQLEFEIIVFTRARHLTQYYSRLHRLGRLDKYIFKMYDARTSKVQHRLTSLK